MDPLSYNEVHSRPSLEERVESIISGAALMADSSCTRDDRRERIVQECNAVRQALQDLLTEYMNNVSVGFFVKKLKFNPHSTPDAAPNIDIVIHFVVPSTFSYLLSLVLNCLQYNTCLVSTLSPPFRLKSVLHQCFSLFYT